MSKTFDRISPLVMADKQRIECAIRSNEQVRERVINLLRETKAYFDKVLGVNK